MLFTVATAGILISFLYNPVATLSLNQDTFNQPLPSPNLTANGPLGEPSPPGPDDPCPRYFRAGPALLDPTSSNQSATLGSFPWICLEIEAVIQYVRKGDLFWSDTTEFQDSLHANEFYGRFFRIEIEATEPLNHVFLALEARTFYRHIWTDLISQYRGRKKVAHNFTPGRPSASNDPNWPLRVDIGFSDRRGARVKLVYYEWVPYHGS